MRQADRQVGRQIGRQADRQIDRQTDRLADRQADKEAENKHTFHWLDEDFICRPLKFTVALPVTELTLSLLWFNHLSLQHRFPFHHKSCFTTHNYFFNTHTHSCVVQTP